LSNLIWGYSSVCFYPIKTITRVRELIHRKKRQTKIVEGFHEDANVFQRALQGNGDQKITDARKNITLFWYWRFWFLRSNGSMKSPDFFTQVTQGKHITPLRLDYGCDTSFDRGVAASKNPSQFLKLGPPCHHVIDTLRATSQQFPQLVTGATSRPVVKTNISNVCDNKKRYA
jgi:hypothetical protein